MVATNETTSVNSSTRRSTDAENGSVPGSELVMSAHQRGGHDRSKSQACSGAGQAQQAALDEKL